MPSRPSVRSGIRFADHTVDTDGLMGEAVEARLAHRVDERGEGFVRVAR